MNTEAIEAIYELQSANGANAKKAVLNKYKDNKDFTRLLYYALNPFYTYKLTEKSLNNYTNDTVRIITWTNIYEVCEYLNDTKAMTNDLLNKVQHFVELYFGKERDLYEQILTKTLRLGVTATTVNKVIKGLIPEWEVQQAYPIDKYPIKPNTWFALTQKLNGVRATYYKGKLYARSGEEYTGLEHIIKELEYLNDTSDLVFDGELTLCDEVKNAHGFNDNEAFRYSTGIINSENTDKTTIQYTVFDCLTEHSFECGISLANYCSRRNKLDAIAEQFKGELNYVHILPLLYKGTDQSVIPKLLDQMVAEDKEGLMLNLNVEYKRKRHKGILKIKRFYTMDLPIVDVEEGTGRLTGTLGAVVVNYKGNKVNVGTGFDDATRAILWANKEDYIGCLCEVKYKEVSYDKKTGIESLQFPVYVSIRKDKNTVSYA